MKKYQYQPDMMSYSLGFLCHFALDLTAHPYINAQTRTKEQRDGLYDHRALESRIDGLLIQSLRQTNQLSSSFKVHSLVRFLRFNRNS